MNTESLIEVYTDGACSGNPGPGGWAFVMVIDGKEPFTQSAGEKLTTNNRMELAAVINALQAISQNYASARICLYTDSQYVKNGITEWIQKWKKNGWKTASKQPVKNQDLWLLLDKLSSELKPEWNWVKGHAGNKFNELCDELAVAAAQSVK
ncbi:ribonuclease HI [Treponema phagedenis]|uniref:Ribonuclease H n=1 Tax=Treponema phagedenis TaxID=162 RepID=A0A0B7GTZ8_TREPH|nr:ribonuclease HI [Treponema phagedenis]EFW38420.1 ribonuclease HI [Treponema phagedenis F0421]QEJ95928.1 ribonuclease HI [Treponema phagedenis]QSH94861.1 ribonuclease HI [Treponema phagedenis]QSH98661.1 ribonuclease HI [Treponema phagedenis]TYT78470.1 ribonuclease HI [Treponema phagedenis]